MSRDKCRGCRRASAAGLSSTSKCRLPSFQRMLRVCVPSLAMARSLLPSQSKSPMAISTGSRFVVYVRETEALAVVARAAVVLNIINSDRNRLRARALERSFFDSIDITCPTQGLFQYNAFAIWFRKNHGAGRCFCSNSGKKRTALLPSLESTGQPLRRGAPSNSVSSVNLDEFSSGKQGFQPDF